ncbi:MAG: FAD-dependent oxidoreductase, partial [Desulfatiglandales bacterium]|nr:FAD-dependent oxidoreductase [Desulfatiglandales bacterium]
KRWSSSPESIAFLMDHQALDREEGISLLKKGHQVILCRARPREQLGKIGEGLGSGTKWVLKKELKMANVQINADAPVEEIKENGVFIKRDGTRQFIEADTVVLATGFTWDNTLYEAIKGSAPEVYTAGAASTVGHMIEGVCDAFDVAMKI